jgi:hypothetical protein
MITPKALIPNDKRISLPRALNIYSELLQL